jgi:hypothetical protein
MKFFNYHRGTHTKSTRALSVLTGSLLFLFAVSCGEEDLEQATISFYPTLAGEVNEPEVGSPGASTTIYLRTSRVLLEDSKVNIRIIGNGAGYGNSYITSPPPLAQGVITLDIPRGENTASFSFTPRNDGIVEKDDYTYTFVIDQFSESINSTGQKNFKLKVKERPLFYFNFDDCNPTPVGFNERIVTGAMAANTWGCTTFGYPNEGTRAVEANAFGKGSGTSNAYLVMSTPIDGDVIDELYLKALVYSRFSGSGQVKFKYSNTYTGTGNPEAAGVTWTEITDMNSMLPSGGTQLWKEVIGTIPDVTGTTYIAIQYVGGTTSSASNWRVENFEIKAN